MKSTNAGVACVSAALLFLGSAAALTGSASVVYGQSTPPIQGLANSAFANPKVDVPSGSTTFNPVGSDNLFTAQLLARITDASQKQTMQKYADQINTMVEKAYTDYGYEKNDVGVAFGGFLEACWELSNGTYKTGNETAQDKEKTKAAIRQMQNALLASPAYKKMPDKNKQLLYEACTFMIGHLAAQWQLAGEDKTKRAAVQQAARLQLQTIFGVGADTLTRRPNGTFVAFTNAPAISNNKVAEDPKGEKVTTEATNKAGATPVAAAATGGPLPAATTHGAQIFIKYTFQPTSTTFDQLILFPSGAAFTDVPSKPVSTFDEATLRASLKPYDVGSWKQSGDTIVLSFPNKKRDQVTTLRKVARGWYDGDGKPDPESAYHTYFPVVKLTPEQLAGAWKHESLTTMGTLGGGAPMVAAGSTGNRVFNANGTFSEGKKSFASATTANMGDAFKSGGDVGTYGTNSKNGVGRWRLDGPLITMESQGKRIVALAYILPNWNKSGPPEILIDGDWWKRPEKK